MQLSREFLRAEAASEKVFARGVDLAADESAVTILSAAPDKVLAIVRGTERYRVTLTQRGQSVHGTCTCPAYDEWPGWCKHLVAVGLVATMQARPVAAGVAGAPAVATPATAALAPLDLIAAYLDTCDRETLIALLREQVEADEGLFRRLHLRAQLADAGTADVGALRQLFCQTLRVRDEDVLEGREVRAYADGVVALNDLLDTLLENNQFAAVKELVETAFDTLADALNSIDDSWGHLTEPLEVLAELHVCACQGLGLSQEAIAALLREKAGDGWGFYRGVEDYR